MQCPRCAYLLGPFEQTCPKCAYLARTRPVSPPVPAGQTPPSPVQTVTLPTGQTYKVCPACRQPAVLHMTACGRCGYIYSPALSGPAHTYGTQPPSSPGYGGSTTASATYSSMVEGRHQTQTARSNGRRVAVVVCALLGLLLVAGVALAPLARVSPQKPGPGLLVVQGGSGRSGSNLLGAAVDTGQIGQRLLEAGAATGGEVEVSLAWNTLTDLDLSVRDPSGELIDAEHRYSASGGVQDVDANPTLVTMAGSARAAMGLNPGPENVEPVPEMLVDLDKKIRIPGGIPGLSAMPGSGTHAPSRFTRTPVEHIYFAHAPKGTYTVYGRCYSWREPNTNPLPFTVEIRSRGKVFYATSGTLGPASYITDNTVPTEVCRFVMP